MKCLKPAEMVSPEPRWNALWSYKLKAGFHRTYNLGQNPDHICMAGSETTLGTIIKSTSMPLGFWNRKDVSAAVCFFNVPRP